MGRGPVRSGLAPIRSLPRCFLPDSDFSGESLEIPKEEYRKFHNVLRLSNGDQVALFPNDGTVWRAELRRYEAVLLEQEPVLTESARRITLAQALPKADKIDEIIRMGTELGVAEFILFSSDRTVVQWSGSKLDDKLHRMGSIAREACEVAYRGRLPIIRMTPNLANLLKEQPEAIVLAETPNLDRTLKARLSAGTDATLVIGPEGGWNPNEVKTIGDRATTLGPRVLRVVTAAVTACALALAD